MNYHLNQNGKDMGIFPLEELRHRRQGGELTGSEQVWCEGMAQWQPLDSVLQPPFQSVRVKFIPPPPLSPARKEGLSPVVIVLLVLGGVAFLAFAALFGVGGYRASKLTPALPVIKQTQAGDGGDTSGSVSAMAAASRPVIWNASTRTWVDVQKEDRQFRFRQYAEGYQQRGERNPECDLLAQQFLTNWITTYYGGTVDTNLPSLLVLSDQLANDPACQDPLVLTLTAVNSSELHESVRRLERAVKGFENSKHRAYPKFYATVVLASKLIKDRNDRLPVLDAQSLQYLKAAFTDGSIQPGDQAGIADVLVNGWGRDFFNRNAVAVYSLVQDQGDAFHWLAAVLEGEHEISEAWRARGGGFVSTVSDTGWKGFSDHLAVARQCLTGAWKLHPELPLAPCRMIYVSLGDADISEMRTWFDRTTAAQIDYAEAWRNMRWGLRPRWYGDYDSMLAFGITALNTRRFDTDVPRIFMDSVSDVESEMNLPGGQRLFGRKDIWPHLQALYEGYIAQAAMTPYLRDAWRSSYTVVAFLAGKYDVARKQLETLNWQPRPNCLNDWKRDLTLLPEEVAARTGSAAAQVNDAEQRRENGDVTGALQAYHRLAALTNSDALSASFVRERLATLGVEQHLQSGEWVDFLPTDTNFTGWHVGLGEFKLRPDGALEVHADENGHLIYSRVRMGTEFEVRGQFEVVSSTTAAFQAGLVMGVPQNETYNWFGFRMKRNPDEGEVASFSQHWINRQIMAPVVLDDHVNSFDFRYHNGLVSATVDGREVFKNVPSPRDAYVTTSEFLLGLGAFNDSNSSVIRYRQIQVRRLLVP